MLEVMKSDLLNGKKGLVMGVANDRSIAWGVARALHASGAEVALSYQGDIMKKRVAPLAESIGIKHLIDCDVSDDNNIKKAFDSLGGMFDGKIDFVIHSIAFAGRESLRGKYCDITKSDFSMAMEISCYSFVSVAHHASSLMKETGSLIAMSYFGAEKVIPNYNVMGVAKAALECSVRYMASDLGESGIRVNSISPGPIKTLAASGIGNFGSVLGFQAENAPLKRNVSQLEVGNTAVFLVSDMSSGITGENIYVDCGYNIIGMPSSMAR